MYRTEMDSSGFLSPKANAFSIAHLIDGSRYPELVNIQGANFNWNSQRLTKTMEGEITEVFTIDLYIP